MTGMAKARHYGILIAISVTVLFAMWVISRTDVFHSVTVKNYPIAVNTFSKYARYTRRLPDTNVTVVNAYFNIGSFLKDGSSTFGPSHYYSWAKIFRYIVNPLVIYTDCDIYKDLMTELRKDLTDRTLIIKTERNSTWSFEIVEQIRKVYSTPGYPIHNPNTVVPEYSSAMHAKYELMADTAKNNPFNTNYFAWVDVGHFRDIIGEKQKFRIDLPLHFNESRLAMNHVNNISLNLQPDKIIRDNLVWLGGGFHLGRSDVVINFGKDYRKAVFYLLSQNLMSSDEQVILFMYTSKGKENVHPKTEVQLYTPSGIYNMLLSLGYRCRKLV